MNLIKKKDPSTRPSTEFLCKPIRGIMEEKSMTRNLEGGIIVRGIIEKESLRRHSGGAIIEEGACRRHLGGIWESARSPLGSICLGVIWGSFGGLEAEEASGTRSEVRSQKSMPLSARTQKFHSNLNFMKRFRRQVSPNSAHYKLKCSATA